MRRVEGMAAALPLTSNVHVPVCAADGGAAMQPRELHFIVCRVLTHDKSSTADRQVPSAWLPQPVRARPGTRAVPARADGIACTQQARTTRAPVRCRVPTRQLSRWDSGARRSKRPG